MNSWHLLAAWVVVTACTTGGSLPNEALDASSADVGSDAVDASDVRDAGDLTDSMDAGAADLGEADVPDAADAPDVGPAVFNPAVCDVVTEPPTVPRGCTQRCAVFTSVAEEVEDAPQFGFFGEEGMPDEDCDGVPDCPTELFDDEGRVVAEWSDADCDCQSDRGSRCRSTEYDSGSGGVAVATDDVDCDGVPERCVREHPELGVLGEDVGCDGSVDRECGYLSVDDAGRETWGNDEDCDGVADSFCTRYTFDDRGNKTDTLTDRNCDGTPEECRVWQYDDADRLIHTHIDEGCDGTPDRRCETTTFDEFGNQLSRDTDDVCNGAGECLVGVVVDGRVTSNYIDSGCDGTPDGGCMERSFDAAGNIVTERVDPDCAGPGQPECWFYGWDGEGNRTSWALDRWCNGSLEMCESWERPSPDVEIHRVGYECASPTMSCTSTRTERDSVGRVLLREVDDDCDGQPDDCTRYTRDADGRATELERSDCVNPGSTWRFDYTGPGSRVTVAQRVVQCD